MKLFTIILTIAVLALGVSHVAASKTTPRTTLPLGQANTVNNLQVQPLGHDTRTVPINQIQGGSRSTSYNLQPVDTVRKLQ